MALGRPRKAGALRTKSGIASRSRESLLLSGDLVHRSWSVYFAVASGRTKIGFSGSLGFRLDAVGREQGEPVRILALALVPTESAARKLEKALHARFSDFHIEGEWFDLGRSDVMKALGECRSIGLSVCGGVDASDDLPVMSGMAFSDQKDRLEIMRS